MSSSPDPTVLTVPGYTGAGPLNWLTLWEQRHPGIERVQQRDWDAPRLDEWVESVEQMVAAAERDVLLAAHSLGSITVVHWAARTGLAARVRGALLVAPADVEQPDVPELLAAFAPIPTQALPFRATVVASDNDPWITAARAGELASAWGANLVQLTGAGHLDSAAGLGEWPAGWQLLMSLRTG